MTLREQIMKLLDTLPDDSINDNETENDTVIESTRPEVETIETSNLEDVEVEAPELEEDVTVITSDDMVEESIDMRLATFYTVQKDLENTVKVLLAEVATLKDHFSTIESAIDEAKNVSPEVHTIDSLVNML